MRSANPAPPRRTPKYIYGPVPSRRLGYSLGVDILPFKTCSMNCVYCQLGSGAKTTIRRREYVPTAAVLKEIRDAIAGGQRLDAVTFSGSGEPTLNSGIGRIIRGIKRTTGLPVVVLTNSSCFVRRESWNELKDADIVVPSLDAATESVFKKINRPHPGLTARAILDGLVKFRDVYKGQIWLEIMLVKGVNDGPAHLRKLKEAAGRIRPDKIQLNTVVRPPAEASARPLDRRALEKIRAFFGEDAEIIAEVNVGAQKAAAGETAAAILATTGRRPVTAADIALSLGRPVEEIVGEIERLIAAKKVRPVPHKGTIYFEKT